MFLFDWIWLCSYLASRVCLHMCVSYTVCMKASITVSLWKSNEALLVKAKLSAVALWGCDWEREKGNKCERETGKSKSSHDWTHMTSHTHTEKEKTHRVGAMATRNSTAGMRTHILGKAMDHAQDGPQWEKVHKLFASKCKMFRCFSPQGPFVNWRACVCSRVFVRC